MGHGGMGRSCLMPLMPHALLLLRTQHSAPSTEIFLVVDSCVRSQQYSLKTMPTPHDPLKQIRIAAPCPATWEAMSGDERRRHCTLCDLSVYNFAEMTGEEIRELLVRSEGRLCARLYRRADGTLLTRDCP